MVRIIRVDSGPLVLRSIFGELRGDWAQLDTTTKALRDGSSSERGVYAASSQMKPVAMGFAYVDRIPTVKRRERRAPIVVVVPSCARLGGTHPNAYPGFRMCVIGP